MQGLRHIFAIFVTVSFLLCLVPGESSILEENRESSNVNDNNYANADWHLSGLSGLTERHGLGHYSFYGIDADSLRETKLENFDFDKFGNTYLAIFANQGSFGGFHLMLMAYTSSSLAQMEI